MRYLLAFILSLALVGCGTVEGRKAAEWASANEKMAEAGEIKWSDFYKQFFDKISALPSHPDKGEYMRMTSVMIDAANALEDGRLNKEQFDSLRRQYKSQIESAEGTRDAQARAYWGNALSRIGQQTTPVYIPPAPPISTPSVVCNSRNVNGGIQTVCR